MGWVWVDDDESKNSDSSEIAKFANPNPNSIAEGGDQCSMRTIVQSKCNTEEVEPGKFVRKCEKTEQILRDCVGKATEIVQSSTVQTEDDVTHEVMKGSSILGSSDAGSFDLSEFRSDIEAIERGIGRFFGAADEMKNGFFQAADEISKGFFRLLDDPSLFEGNSSSSSRRKGIPIEGRIQKEPETNSNKMDSGNLDISGLARDV